jgi:autotransporter-associated beta strand protein
MKNQSITLAFLLALLFLLIAKSSHAGSATWKLDPTSGDWNSATNWMPATVPNGSADTATFALSTTTGVSLSAAISLDGIVFGAGASAFTIAFPPNVSLLLEGVGITNNSGVIQTFVANVDGAGNSGAITFSSHASAGSSNSFTNRGAVTSGAGGANTFFFGFSTADKSTFTNDGGVADGALGGVATLSDSSTAANGTFIANGGVVSGAGGGSIEFESTSKAENATLIANGGAVSGAGGGIIEFHSNSFALDATLIANGGTNGGTGGQIYFYDFVGAGFTRVEVFGNGTGDVTNGTFDISALFGSGRVTVRSIEGSGLVTLGSHELSIEGSSTKFFSGKIQDGPTAGGSLTKYGSGKLTLSGANTYTGGTKVREGTLQVSNRSGSATGTGTVAVTTSTLGGRGKISGAVKIGGEMFNPAILAPGMDVTPDTLTIRKTLTFNATANYQVDLKSDTVTADQVVAKGVTINSGATVTMSDLGTATLSSGTVFTIINNRATTPILGTFSNLGDGSTITIGTNTFQASYEGGDGNDLTLTVVP